MASSTTLSQESLEAILFHPLVKKRDITLTRALWETDEHFYGKCIYQHAFWEKIIKFLTCEM